VLEQKHTCVLRNTRELNGVLTTIYSILYTSDHSLLQTQVFRVGQVNEPCIGLTQENLIENSVQDCLPYILKPYGLYYSMSQTSFSLYLHNQWTNFHKPSCTRKPQMRAICTYMRGTKVTTND